MFVLNTDYTTFRCSGQAFFRLVGWANSVFAHADYIGVRHNRVMRLQQVPWGQVANPTFQISFVWPGIATGLVSKSPNSYFGGLRSSFEAFIAQSHFRARPV
jgi:hypothetical protein